MTPDPRRDGGRSAAEWVSFAVACLVLALVIGLIALEMRGDEVAAAPVVEPAGTAAEEADGFHVPVEIRNEGDEAASDVQVIATLTIDGEPTEGDLTVDFLAGGASEELVFVFPDDPADGELELRVASYSTP